MVSRLGLVVLFVAFTSFQGLSQEFGAVRKGKIDLRAWNASEHPSLLLDGEWEFYWKKLILSKDIKAIDTRVFAEFSIPWNEQIINGQKYPKDGYATYSVQILLPKNTQKVSFAVPAVFNSYAFWVNDKLICASGKVASSASEMHPMWKPQTVDVTTVSDTLQVIFQIANFQHTRGGCAEHMRIGSTPYLSSQNAAFHTSGIALILFFGITALCGLVVSFVNRRHSLLFLALLSLSYTLRFLFSDLYFYYDIGINPGWEVASKIEYITVPLIVLSASLFLSAIYPQEFKRTILYFLVTINAVLIAVVIVAPFSILSPVLVILQVVGLIFIGVIFYVIVKALILRRSGAWISGLGVLVFALVGFYNIYSFMAHSDLNRVIIHSGYAIALLLNIFSLLYRTPLRLKAEESDVLRYSDLYNSDGSSKY